MDAGPKMSEQNCAVVRRFIDKAFNNGETRLLAELIAPEHVSHLPNGDHYGPEGVRIDIDCFRNAFPDFNLAIEDMIDAGDAVVYRFTARGTHEGPFMGVPASGKRVAITGIGIDLLSDGRSIERWVQFDSAGLLQQLGVLAV
jgi:steroid delta-isomerase-like uncharacterized protein